jgi:hypothetical protein
LSRLFSQGREAETLNILKRIHRINNPESENEFSVTKVVEDLEFIGSDAREITDVSRNPFALLWTQTCLLFSGENLKNTTLICLMQASASFGHARRRQLT